MSMAAPTRATEAARTPLALVAAFFVSAAAAAAFMHANSSFVPAASVHFTSVFVWQILALAVVSPATLASPQQRVANPQSSAAAAHLKPDLPFSIAAAAAPPALVASPPAFTGAAAAASLAV